MSSQCDHFWMMLNSAVSLVWKHINLFGLLKTWVINSGIEDYIINWEFNLTTRSHAGWIFFLKFLTVLGLVAVSGLSLIEVHRRFIQGRLLLLWSVSTSVHGLQGLWPMSLVSPWHVGSSLTRDQIHVSCIGRQNSLPLSHQGSTRVTLLFKIQHNIWQQIVIFYTNFLISKFCRPRIAISTITPWKRLGEALDLKEVKQSVLNTSMLDFFLILLKLQ